MIGRLRWAAPAALLALSVLPAGAPTNLPRAGAVPNATAVNHVSVSVAYDSVDYAAAAPDGSIVAVIATASASPGSSLDLLRLQPGGVALDPTFGTGGLEQLPASAISALGIDPQGRIVLRGVIPAEGGKSTTWVARYLSSGQPDLSFASSGQVADRCPGASGNQIAFATSGGFFISSVAVSSGPGPGAPRQYTTCLAHYTDSGLDQTFDAGSGAVEMSLQGPALAIAALQNGGVEEAGDGQIAAYDSSGRQLSAGALEDAGAGYGIQVMAPTTNPGLNMLAGDNLEWATPSGRTDGFPGGACGTVVPYSVAGPVVPVSSGFAALQGEQIDQGSSPSAVIEFKDGNARPDERLGPGGILEVPASLSVLAAGSSTLYGLGRPYPQPSTGGTLEVAVIPTPVGNLPAPPAEPDNGLLAVGADGGVFAFGDGFGPNNREVPLADAGQFCGSMGATHLNRPVVGGSGVPGNFGYWLVASDGGIFTFGAAGFYGSAGDIPLNQPIVGMAPTPDGKGYWLVASDGGVFTYGAAHFYGSAGGMRLNEPIVGMAATADGGGYWLVASDGGVFSFGDAVFHGSTGAMRLNAPVVGMAATADGDGYWLAARDGGVFSFGSARYSFSDAANQFRTSAAPIAGIARIAGNRYALVSADGQICAESPGLSAPPGYLQQDQIVDVSCDAAPGLLNALVVGLIG